jgi:predicted PurR-regulated permease PerM
MPHLPSRVERGTFAFLFAVAAFLFLWTISPIWVPLLLGALLAVVAMPLQARLVRRLPRHPRVVAALITAAVLTVGTGLIVFIGYVVLREIVRFFSDGHLQEHVRGIVQWVHSRPAVSVLARVGENPEHLIESVRERAASVSTWMSTALSSLLAVTSNGVLTLILTAITSYYLLLEGRALADFLLRVLPLPAEETRSLMREFREASVAILLGIGVIAVYQGVTAGLGFFLFGVPKPLVWGALTAVVSLLPVIGTGLTCVPLAIILMLTHHVVAGIGLVVWWFVVVVLIADYGLRPHVMEGRMRMHTLLVLISLFGGIEAFGAFGLALGPLCCALFVALLRIYERDYRPPPTDAAGATTA